MNRYFFLIVMCLIFVLSEGNVYAIEDYFVKSTLCNNEILKPKSHSHYDYTDTDVVKIKLLNIKNIKSEKELKEGEILNFKVAGDVIHNGKTVIKSGTSATAKVETVISNGMNGIPASVILGDFKIADIEPTKIAGGYEKYGFDLSWLVFPVKWALTPFPPTGSLTNFIKGGHVKLREGKILTVYYHPNWI